MNNIFIDTNILIYSQYKDSSHYQSSIDILKSLIDNNTNGIITPYIINELHYFFIKQFDHKTAKIHTLRLLNLPQINLTDITLSKKDLTSITTISSKYHLKTFDAFHAFFAKKLKIKQFATFDTDFSSIPWLKLITT